MDIYIGLVVEVRSDVVKVSDEAIENYYVKIMDLVPEAQSNNKNLSKGDRRLSFGKQEISTGNSVEKVLA